MHARQTADALRELAEQADRGELIGIAYAAFAQDKSVVPGMAGYANSKRRDACFGAKTLLDMLHANTV